MPDYLNKDDVDNQPSNQPCRLPRYHIKDFELTWNVLQYPPAPLKVGTPLSALTPAPDNTTICLALESTCLNSAMSDDCRAPSNFAIVWYRHYYMDNGTHDRTHKKILHSCLLFSVSWPMSIFSNKQTNSLVVIWLLLKIALLNIMWHCVTRWRLANKPFTPLLPFTRLVYIV